MLAPIDLFLFIYGIRDTHILSRNCPHQTLSILQLCRVSSAFPSIFLFPFLFLLRSFHIICTSSGIIVYPLFFPSPNFNTIKIVKMLERGQETFFFFPIILTFSTDISRATENFRDKRKLVKLVGSAQFIALVNPPRASFTEDSRDKKAWPSTIDLFNRGLVNEFALSFAINLLFNGQEIRFSPLVPISQTRGRGGNFSSRFHFFVFQRYRSRKKIHGKVTLRFLPDFLSRKSKIFLPRNFFLSETHRNVGENSILSSRMRHCVAKFWKPVTPRRNVYSCFQRPDHGFRRD